MLTELNINTPYPPDPFKDIYTHIRDIKELFGERFGLDHYIGSSQDTTLSTADGYHKQITIYGTSVEPEITDTESIMFASKKSITSPKVDYIDLVIKNSTTKTYLTLKGRSMMSEFRAGFSDSERIKYCIRKIALRYFAFGEKKIWVSDDLINWVEHLDIGIDVLYDCIYGANKWVAVGLFCIYYSSDDGTTWTRVSVSSVTFKSIAYSGSQFMAVGVGSPTSAANIYTSPDGVTWYAKAKTGTLATSGAVILVNSLFAVTCNNDSTPYIAYSANGTTWGKAYMPITVTTLTGICYYNGLWVAVGSNLSIFTASAVDGTWTLRRSESPAIDYGFTSVMHDGSRFIAVGIVGFTGVCYYSTDGITWTSKTITVPNNYFHRMQKIDQYHILLSTQCESYTLNFI